MKSDQQWRAIVLSFAAGAASMSVLWYARDRRRRHINKSDDDNGSEMDVRARADMQHSSSFLETVKQSVEDAVEDIRSCIGELPSKSRSRRRRWPWETINTNRRLRNANNTRRKSPSSPAPTISNTQSKDADDLCIGSIFGLDVGGTLAKLVYFEQQHDCDVEIHTNIRERLYHKAASAQAVLKARRGSQPHLQPATNLRSSMGAFTPLRERSFSSGVLKRKLSSTSSAKLNGHHRHHSLHMDMEHKARHQDVHTSESDDDLKGLYKMRQESVPDDLHAYATSVHYNGIGTRGEHDNQNINQSNKILFTQDDSELGKNSKQSSPTPTTADGIRKSRSMLDLNMSDKSRDHAEALDRFYHFARKLDTYREGVKDNQLSFFSRALGGEFHFIRFETRHMENAMELIRANDLHLTIREMGATGGGAHKYAADWDRILGIQMKKQEELDSLVAGMQFVLSTVVGECYTFRPRKAIKKKESGATDSNLDEEEKNSPSPGCRSPGDLSSDDSDLEGTDRDSHGTDEWWWSRKVQRDAISYSSAYPYLLVTIGTGVSILRVDGPRKHERISGSTIGGGTYWGLIRLLTDLEDFEDVMQLAEHGDPSKVDMMVGDIYGNNKEALEKLGLPASLVASSFGKLVAREDPAAGLKQEDLARALLLMVTNNIGQVAYLNAQLHKTSRIYFVGNFLRGNKLSQRRLSFAINYWSKGEMEALFLEHEGYFGALGAFLLSQAISLDHYSDSRLPSQNFTSQNKNESDDYDLYGESAQQYDMIDEQLTF